MFLSSLTYNGFCMFIILYSSRNEPHQLSYLKQHSLSRGWSTCLETESFRSLSLCSDLLPEAFYIYFLGFSHCFYGVIYYIGWWSCGSSWRASEWGAVYRWAWQHRHQKGQLSHPTAWSSQQSHFNIHQLKWNNHIWTAVTKWVLQ